jgi:hypothetical protein
MMRVLALTFYFLSTYLGFIVPTRASIEQHPSFGNYISAGLEISLVVAIDYTGKMMMMMMMMMGMIMIG